MESDTPWVTPAPRCCICGGLISKVGVVPLAWHPTRGVVMHAECWRGVMYRGVSVSDLLGLMDEEHRHHGERRDDGDSAA